MESKRWELDQKIKIGRAKCSWYFKKRFSKTRCAVPAMDPEKKRIDPKSVNPSAGGIMLSFQGTNQELDSLADYVMSLRK